MKKSTKTWRRVRCFSWLAVLVLCSAIPSRAHRQEYPGVLILHFGQKEAPNVALINAEVVRVLQAELRYPVDLYVDSVDSLAAGDPTRQEHDRALVKVLRQRYSRANVHLLVPVANEAIDFVKAHGREICPEASVVYLAQSFGKPPATPPLLDATGGILLFDAKPTLDLALAQNPGTRHVAVIAGTAPFEKLEIAAVRDDFRKYGDALDFQYITDVTYAEALARLAKLPAHSIVLLLSFARDAAGDVFISAHVEPFFAKAATGPTYVVYSSAVGYGAVGGQVHDFQEIGRIIGKQVAQVLSGTRASDLPIVEGTFQRPMFDWQQMQRWRIGDKKIPPGSVVINRQYTVWDRYKWWIVAIVVLSFLETILVVSLVLARIREGRAERQLAARVRHEQLVAELAASFIDRLDEPPGQNVEQGFERLLNLYQLDRIALFEFSEDRRTMKLRYLHKRPGASGVPQEIDIERIRWVADQLCRGKSCHAASLAEIPQAGRSARELLESMQVRSYAIFPLHSEKRVIGALSFVSLTRLVFWTPELLQELHTIADIFSNALDRKRAEEALRSSQELNGTVLDSLSSNLAVIDGRGKIIAVNKRWTDFWADNGGPPESFPGIGANYLDLCRRSIGESRDADRALAGILAVLEGKRDKFQMEYEVAAPDRRRWFDMYVSPLLHASDGAVVRHIDITYRKESEVRLRESEERFRLIADTAPVMIWISGTDRLCTYVNKAWLDFTGRPLELQLGDGWAEGIHPDDRDRCVRIYNQAFEAQRPFTMEYRLRRRDGKYRWILDNGAPRRFADGAFAGFIGGCVDVTEQKESEEARSHLSGLLLTAQEQERSSIARELHDHINQRLALLAIELQMFEQSAADLDAEQRKYLGDLWSLTNEISHDVQVLSHQLHSSQLQHLGLVAAVRNLCEEFSRTTDLEAECTCTGSPARIDENVSLALFRVSQEALRNAGKYSRATVVKVELAWKEKEVSLAVADDGAGFDLDATGTGLGLISMRERMHLVGGDLSVTSAPGQGTRIEARVPLVRVDAIAPANAPTMVERRKRVRA